MSETTQVVVSAARRRLTLVVLSIGCATYTLLQSLLFPVLPALQSALHTSQAEVTWVLTAYLLSASVCTPILGRLGDRFGKKRMLVVALAALALGSLLAAVATTLSVMVVARAIQGVGGGVLPLSFGLVHEQVPEDEVAGAIGIISSICGIGSGCGVVLAGPIISALDYHWLFWIPLVPTALAATAGLIVIPEGPVERTGRMKPVAFVLLAGWLVTLLLAVSEGSVWGWASPRVIVLFVASALLVPLWIQVEQRSPTPLIDMAMMRRRAVWTNNLATLLVGTCMFGSLVFVAEFAQTPARAGYGFGSSVLQAGLVISPQPVLVIVVGFVTGLLTARVGSHGVLFLGALGCGVAMLLAAVAHDAEWELYLAMGVLGVGIGLVVAAQSAIAVSSVPREQTGVAAGMNANIRQIGGSIGAAAMGAVVSSVPQRHGFPAESGYTAAFLMVAVLGFAGAAVALRVPADQRPDRHLDTTRGTAAVVEATVAGVTGTVPLLDDA